MVSFIVIDFTMMTGVTIVVLKFTTTQANYITIRNSILKMDCLIDMVIMGSIIR